MLDTILLITICSLGMVFTYPLKKTLPFLFLVAISPLTGGLIWMLIVIFAGLFNLPPSGPLMLFVCLFFAGVYFFIFRGYQQWRIGVREVLIISLLFSFIFASVQIIQNIDDFVFHTTDSFIMVDMGRYWLDPSTEQDPGDLPFLREKASPDAEYLPHMLNAYGFFIPSIQSTRLFTNTSALAYFPIMSIGFILASGILLDRIIKLYTGFHKKSRLLLVFAVLVTIASNAAYLNHSRYLHSNLTAGVFLALAVLTFMLYLLEEENTWLILSVFMLLGLSFARTETPIWALVTTSFFVLNGPIPTTIRRRVFLPLLLGIALWHLLIYADLQILGSGINGVLNLSLLIVLSITFIIAAIAIYFLELLPDKLFPFLKTTLIGSLIVLSLYILNSPQGIQTSQSLLINIGFHRGLWGVYWYFVIGIVFVIPDKTQKTSYQVLKQAIFIGLLLIIIASGFRHPYRPGWSDSGNRMLMHVFPLFTVYLGIKIAVFFDWLQKEKSREPAIS